MINKIIVLNFISGPLAEWLPFIFLNGIFSAAVILYSQGGNFKKKCKILVITLVVFRFFYAAFLSVIQYYVWSHNFMAKYFLPPYQPMSYFLRYSWTHFWFGTLIIIFLSLLLWLIMGAFKKYRDHSLDDGEIELVVLMSLLVGWPNFIVFLPLALFLACAIALFHQLIFKNKHISLGWPLILAALFVLFFGAAIINMFNLGYLRV